MCWPTKNQDFLFTRENKTEMKNTTLQIIFLTPNIYDCDEIRWAT